jgi:hypothetical protein
MRGQAAPAIVHDISQVDLCPDLPAAAQAKVRSLLRLHEDVFEGRQITMPKPFQAEPVELKFNALRVKICEIQKLSRCSWLSS